MSEIERELETATAKVIEFPNAMTPEQRAEVDHCMNALEIEAEKWGQEAGIGNIAKMLAHTSRLAPHAPNDVREKFIARQEAQIAAMIEQAFIEGAYRGCIGAYDSVRLGYDPHTRTMAAPQPPQAGRVDEDMVERAVAAELPHTVYDGYDDETKKRFMEYNRGSVTRQVRRILTAAFTRPAPTQGGEG